MFPRATFLIVLSTAATWLPTNDDSISAQQFEFIGKVAIPGDSVDLTNDATTLENGEPRNRFGGISAIDWTGSGDRYLALPDRGPDDGAVSYPCRAHVLEIAITPNAAEPVIERLVETKMLLDEKGRSFIGSSAAIEASATIGSRLDPEAVRVGPNESFYISDEYGPLVATFNSDGRLQHRFDLPKHLLVKSPHADKLMETTENKSGRAANRGMECLAVTPDGRSLVGLMQGPLIQDGERTETGIVIGRNCRLVKIDVASGDVSEFLYEMHDATHGNSEIVAVTDSEFLVLERDSIAGEASAYRRLIAINIEGATNIRDQKRIKPSEVDDLKPVSRREFLDLLDPRWKLAGPEMPEKIEGVTFGPNLPDGRRTLLISTDNDFESANPTWIWVFAVSM